MTAASGKAAVDNANGYTSYDVGMCQQFVRGPCWEVGAYFGSAIEAWEGAALKHPGDRTPPVGAPLYYRGGQYGHTVIAKPNAAGMRSTDCPSSGRVSDEDIAWVERTWGYEYLGWTGDLNGVRLPLDTGEDEDEMKPEDWDKLRQIVRDEVWERKLPVDAPDGHETKKAAGQMLREILQRLQKK